MTSANAPETEGELLPPRDGETNRIPDVGVGDEIKVKCLYNHEPDRTLTVEDVRDHDDLMVAGYGTEYRLYALDEMKTRRVLLSWRSRPEGCPVAEIEVTNRE